LAGYLSTWAHEREQLGQDTRLLFVHPSGEPLHPDWITELFHRHRKAAELPRIRLHDVRHSYPTAAMKAGVSPKIISERLGHSTVAFTLQTYAHVIPSMDEAAASLTAALILAPHDDSAADGSIFGSIEVESGQKKNWPGTKSQASDGSGGRI